MSIQYGACGKHPNFPMVNCPQCKIEQAGSKATESAGVWKECSDGMPVIDNKNPKHYIFLNTVNHVATNIYTGFIDGWPPLLLPRNHWKYLDESPSPSLLQQENERLREALKELVELKGMHDEHDKAPMHLRILIQKEIDSYNKRKPLAWEAARKLLK